MKNNCDNCGTKLIPEAKFCRRCGQPTPFAEGVSVTEAATRILDASINTNGASSSLLHYSQSIPNDYSPLAVASAPTATAQQNATTHLAHTPITQGLNAPTCKSNTAAWLIAFVAVLMLFASAPFALRYFTQSRTSATTRRIIIQPPPPSAVPDAPLPPSVDDKFVYPNSSVKQRIVGQGKASVLRLQSTDSFDNIVAWYEQQLRPKQKIILPGVNAILKADATSVIINGAGDHTEILVTEKSSDE